MGVFVEKCLLSCERGESGVRFSALFFGDIKVVGFGVEGRVSCSFSKKVVEQLVGALFIIEVDNSCVYSLCGTGFSRLFQKNKLVIRSNKNVMSKYFLK